MYIITNSDLSCYDIGTDVLVENINEFLTNVVLGIIDSQKIVVDEEFGEAISILEDNSFDVVMLHSYLKYKPKTETETKSDPNTTQVTKETKPLAPKPNIKQEKTGFFSRLFSKKVKEVPIEEINVSIADAVSRLNTKDVRGQKVKNYCLANGLLTEAQIHKIEQLMDDSYKFGLNKRFIQCAREGHYLTEDQAAQVLSKLVSKEVISKNKCTPALIGNYNVEFLSLLSDFFIYNINPDKKEITICKDCSDEPELYLLEKKYMGYHIIVLNVIEGVTKEVIKELKAGGLHG